MTIKKKPIICDGCNVQHLWEHKCHGENAIVNKKPTGKPCQCKECKWKTFLFKGNEFSAMIDSRAKWAEAVLAYENYGGISFLLKAKERLNTMTDMPEFGFYDAHTGSGTLGEWAEQNKL